jgi:hypothetical protein
MTSEQIERGTTRSAAMRAPRSKPLRDRPAEGDPLHESGVHVVPEVTSTHDRDVIPCPDDFALCDEFAGIEHLDRADLDED